MQHLAEASDYRRGEREEIERAHHSPTLGARESHLSVAALYRRPFALFNYQPAIIVDMLAEKRS